MLSYSIPSWSQAFIHHDPRKFQPEPFSQFFDAYGEPLKLKTGNLHDVTTATRHPKAAANVPIRVNSCLRVSSSIIICSTPISANTNVSGNVRSRIDCG